MLTSRTRVRRELSMLHTAIDVSRTNRHWRLLHKCFWSYSPSRLITSTPLEIRWQQCTKALKNPCYKAPFFYFSTVAQILNRGCGNGIGLLTQGTKSHSHLKAALYKLEVVTVCLSQLSSSSPEVWALIPINFAVCVADENPKLRQMIPSCSYWMSLQLDGP